jgi:putative membrane protein
MYAILRWIINAFLLMLIPYIVPGVAVSNFYTALITALVLAFVNAIIRPVILILTLPINILTLGLFTLVINALMFWFVATFIKGFTITGFWPAFWAAIVYSIFSMIINYFAEEKYNKNI